MIFVQMPVGLVFVPTGCGTGSWAGLFYCKGGLRYLWYEQFIPG